MFVMQFLVTLLGHCLMTLWPERHIQYHMILQYANQCLSVECENGNNGLLNKDEWQGKKLPVLVIYECITAYN